MHRTLIASTAALALVAGTVGVSSRAEALAPWIVPVIIASAFGGLVVGGAVGQASAEQRVAPPPAAPSGAIYVQPGGTTAGPVCHIERQRLTDGTTRRVRVCE